MRILETVDITPYYTNDEDYDNRPFIVVEGEDVVRTKVFLEDCTSADWKDTQGIIDAVAYEYEHSPRDVEVFQINDGSDCYLFCSAQAFHEI